jgi:diadenosine tetraphosphate (Ap4A) HIT family hydrolase
MNDFSKTNIIADCPHCNPKSFALKHPLEITDNFWVDCDVHPIVEGHILIIPRSHLSSMGEYPSNLFKEFEHLYNKFSAFIKQKFGSISTFEHGNIGQTVFHSHVHLIPYAGRWETIIPEGKKYIKPINDIKELQQIFQEDREYLFFTIGNHKWTVNTDIAVPRFFRDRFAYAIGNANRGNWKIMHQNKTLMDQANREIKSLEDKWRIFKSG